MHNSYGDRRSFSELRDKSSLLHERLKSVRDALPEYSERRTDDERHAAPRNAGDLRERLDRDRDRDKLRDAVVDERRRDSSHASASHSSHTKRARDGDRDTPPRDDRVASFWSAWDNGTDVEKERLEGKKAREADLRARELSKAKHIEGKSKQYCPFFSPNPALNSCSRGNACNFSHADEALIDHKKKDTNHYHALIEKPKSSSHSNSTNSSIKPVPPPPSDPPPRASSSASQAEKAETHVRDFRDEPAYDPMAGRTLPGGRKHTRKMCWFYHTDRSKDTCSYGNSCLNYHINNEDRPYMHSLLGDDIQYLDKRNPLALRQKALAFAKGVKSGSHNSDHQSSSPSRMPVEISSVVPSGAASAITDLIDKHRDQIKVAIQGGEGGSVMNLLTSIVKPPKSTFTTTTATANDSASATNPSMKLDSFSVLNAADAAKSRLNKRTQSPSTNGENGAKTPPDVANGSMDCACGASMKTFYNPDDGWNYYWDVETNRLARLEFYGHQDQCQQSATDYVNDATVLLNNGSNHGNAMQVEGADASIVPLEQPALQAPSSLDPQLQILAHLSVEDQQQLLLQLLLHQLKEEKELGQLQQLTSLLMPQQSQLEFPEQALQPVQVQEIQTANQNFGSSEPQVFDIETPPRDPEQLKLVSELFSIHCQETLSYLDEIMKLTR